MIDKIKKIKISQLIAVSRTLRLYEAETNLCMKYLHGSNISICQNQTHETS